jgi:hypothetical protein
MDFAAPLKNEVFRPIMTLVVPGATAVAPYALLVRHYEPAISDSLTRHPSIGYTVLAIAALAAGFVIEDIASGFEDLVIDQWLECKKKGHRDTWKKYLALALPTNPIGQRYLRRVLLRMQFELHFAVALIAAWVGWARLQAVDSPWSRGSFVAFSIFSLAVVVFLLIEAFQSAGVLSDVRQNLVGHYYEIEFKPKREDLPATGTGG